ncbi:Uncharacterized membrane protein YpjA [Haladaptatus litoreus]|uniref:Uncharacterized membrane protein YpjA n=1 Tax=Haladaptatus litoreus TaxID=553468 RepID=A0A1N7B6W0_9EURY|nr:DUF1405 domain-containing protein [Haladaptatus litoreus]SIR47044.1 Uncharacterized membrane protein YpjA [Haladaptatus litoreus]
MTDLPPRENLPWYVAPLPQWLEDFGLRMAWVIVAINLVGTAFGFWYYGFHPIPLSDPLITWQFAVEPPEMWLFVPDSPVATLFIALSLGLWKLGRNNEWVNALAFFGCIKLGAWTPYVLVAFADGFLAGTAFPMYLFLFFSHLAMVVEAFLIYRYSDFPVGAVFVAVLWYGVNDIVDYFVPIVGTPHHTALPAQEVLATGYSHPSPTHEIAAAGAVTLTLLATFLALSTRVKKLESVDE